MKARTVACRDFKPNQLLPLQRICNMKQRTTYLLPEGHRADAEDIEIDSDSLKYTKAGQAAEEWRITLAWDELPSSVGLLENIARCFYHT